MTQKRGGALKSPEAEAQEVAEGLTSVLCWASSQRTFRFAVGFFAQLPSLHRQTLKTNRWQIPVYRIPC